MTTRGPAEVEEDAPARMFPSIDLRTDAASSSSRWDAFENDHACPEEAEADIEAAEIPA